MEYSKNTAVQAERIKTEIANATLARQKGSDLSNSGELARGTLWLVKSLQTCPESALARDLEGIIRTDLASRILTLHRLERAFSIPGSFVAFGFRPTGEPLLLDGAGGKLKDLTTGRTLGDLPIDSSKISARALSPDAQIFATSNLGGEIYFFRVADGQPLGDIRTHQGHVRFITFTPDGAQLLVVATPDMADHLKPYVALQSYDVATQQPTDVAFACKDILNMAAYSQDGRYVAAAGQDGIARLWDAATDAAFGPPLPHPGVVFSGEYVAAMDG
jgi:WD40 repeat protein